MSDVIELRYSKDVPTWVESFKTSYLQTSLGQFIIHGNVHDLVFANGRSWSMASLPLGRAKPWAIYTLNSTEIY